MMTRSHPIAASRCMADERGLTLVVALIFLAILAVLGTTAVTMLATDMRIGGNVKQSRAALASADAGVHFTLGSLPGLIADGTNTLRKRQSSLSFTK